MKTTKFTEVMKMKDSLKISKFGIYVSLFGMIVILLSIIYSIIKGHPLRNSYTLLAAMTTILCSNLAIYSSNKKKCDNNTSK